MMFDFIYTAYRFSVPILLVVFLLLKKQNKLWLKNAFATSNLLLIFYCVHALWQLVDLLIQMNNYQSEGYSFWFSRTDISTGYGMLFYANLLALILPFVFLVRKLKASIALVLLEILLLWSNEIFNPLIAYLKDYQPSSYSISISTFNLTIKILHYISLFIGTYALLWLLKKLPSQQASK